MKKIYLFLLMIAVCGFSLNAQTETTINVGDDLIQAIQDAADGDILVLARGIHVAKYTNMDIKKTLTIKGASGGEMPKLYIQQFDVYADGVSFTLQNLDILGARIDSATGEQLPLEELESDYVMNLVSSSLEPTDGAYNTFGDLTFQGCMVSHIDRSAIRGDRDSYSINTILIDDCIMHDFRGGGDYGPFRLKSKLTFNSFTATNSTFYDFPRVFLDCQDMASNPTTYHVENCTFYKWGGIVDGGKYLFDIKTNDQATLVIKSCILGKAPQNETLLVEGFRFMEEAFTEISFCAMTPDLVTNSMGYAEVLWDKDEYNVTDFDPEWADPENGDFTLPEGSDLLQMSPEGTIIGDPRWDPNAGGSDATLSALGVDVGTLDPAFDAGTTSYSLEVPAGTGAINITATATDANATVSGDGEFTNIPGTATITVTAEDGTTTMDYTIDITVSVGMGQVSVPSVGIYPNPASDRVWVTLQEAANISVFAITGQKVRSAFMEAGEHQLTVSDLDQGVYFITTDTHTDVIKLIVK